ncbi:hypothetical protein [Streptomyces jumonjinensis]|uniref:hypothetical protein n=1 Tax=Streptomyces jumonjinensis TaxID=1945 RepID=UPI00378D20AA
MSLPVPCTPARAPGTAVHVRRLERRLLAYAGCDDLILLYPVYAVFFTEHGLSTARISTLFAVWSLTALLVEVPSGVWADAVSRRLLLIAGPLLQGAGFGLWVAFPSYGVFALGFVLWGVGGALRSGALEALVHDELDRLGAAGTGAAAGEVPLLVLAVWAGVTAGGLLAARATGVAPPVAGAVLAAAGLVLSVGALSGAPAGFALIAVAFLVSQLADIVADTRLQAAIAGPSRATVTSLAGFGASVLTLLVYAVYGAASGLLGHGALFALPYPVVGLAVAWSGRRHGDDPP